MFKTKNLFALMALGSALTLVGCGDDDNGVVPPATDVDAGSDSGTTPPVETTETTEATTAPASEGTSAATVDTDAEAPVVVDGGDVDAEVPVVVDGGDVDAEAPVVVDGGAVDAEAPVAVDGGDVDAEVPVETLAPAADAGDAG
jgi:hypothetical protein